MAVSQVSRTDLDRVAARFRLKPGRKYEEAVRAFEPYNSIKEENPEARAAGRAHDDIPRNGDKAANPPRQRSNLTTISYRMLRGSAARIGVLPQRRPVFVHAPKRESVP